MSLWVKREVAPRGSSVITNSRRMRRLLSWAACGALGLCLAGGLAGVAHADTFFDWQGEPTKPVGPGYVVAPTLTDATAATVDAYLTAQQALGQTLAVKEPAGTTLSPAT